MKVLLISGSASMDSGNYFLLEAIAQLIGDRCEVELFQGLYRFDLFSPQRLNKGIPRNIQTLKDKILASEVVFISTPEYTHNIPAVLKNFIEWCTSSGEFSEKKVVAITFTPHAPRGEYAMKSLLASLNALGAKVLTQIQLYKTDVENKERRVKLNDEQKEMIQAVLELF